MGQSVFAMVSNNFNNPEQNSSYSQEFHASLISASASAATAANLASKSSSNCLTAGRNFTRCSYKKHCDAITRRRTDRGGRGETISSFETDVGDAEIDAAAAAAAAAEV